MVATATKGPEKAVLHFRQLTRADEKEKADNYGDWQLGDIFFDENTYLEGTGIITKSNAGTKLTQDLLKKWNVIVGNNNVGKVDWKF